MAAKDSVVVQNAAAAGHQWAIKLRSKGWNSLSKAQKASARAAGVGTVLPTVVQPRVTRLVGGNPSNSRRSPGEPGNAMKTMTITKQEFLGSVFADGKVHTFPIDPRNVATFPQISALALGYNKYRITSLRLRYSPRAVETDCGFIAAFTSDTADKCPTSKFQLYNIIPRFECSASKPLLATIPVEKSQKFLRDRESDDSKLVDCGSIHYLVDGSHDGRVGELFLDVTLVLAEPTFSQSALQQVLNTRSIRGPNYVKVVKSADTTTITFLAPGEFLCSVHSDPILKVAKLGLEEAKQTLVTSDEKTCAVFEAVALEPGGSIVIHHKSPDAVSTFVYISRM